MKHEKLIIAVVLLVFLAVLLYVFPVVPSPDAPGYWLPAPTGSGWCTAHGVQGIKDGTRAHCPHP